MAYRDASVAARARVREAQERVQLLEERITPALLEHLDAAQRDELRAAAAAVDAEVSEEVEAMTIEAAQAALPLLARFEEALQAAVEVAPELAKAFNRIPRTFAPRGAPVNPYAFPDVYHPEQVDLRNLLHGWIRERDPKANILSARPGYDDTEMSPWLVEARFTLDSAPLRLQVMPAGTVDGAFGLLPFDLSLFVRTRPSTPDLRLTREGMGDGVLKLLRLAKEANLDDEPFDDTFFVHASDEVASRVLRPTVRAALLEVAASERIELSIVDGVARLDWTEKGPPHRLEPAILALQLIRKTPPVRLLRPAKKDRG
ncbi:MAG: hypothetical protein KC731_28995 [Myxococcales bacterium]|nr:hypothetical protein [Myxococcales bacterium]